MSATPCSVPSESRLSLRPRSQLLARVEGLLAAAGPRLDRVDPPPTPPEHVTPASRPRLLGRDLPRADR